MYCWLFMEFGVGIGDNRHQLSLIASEVLAGVIFLRRNEVFW
jgi:hypothetical protein